MISRAHKFAETVIAGIISVDMTKKKYPRGKNTPLNRTRGKAWVSVFRGLYSFNDNQSFCTWINDINDNISSESSVFISKNPKESIRKWTNDIQAPGFEVLEQASIYVAEDFGLVESNLLGYSYLFGPSRLFLGYRLANSNIKVGLVDFQKADDEWFQKQYLFAKGEYNNLSFHQFQIFGYESTRRLPFLIHDIFIACESLALSKHICRLNKNPRFLGSKGIPGIEAVAGVQMLDTIDALAFEVLNQESLTNDLGDWGLTLDDTLTLIPKHFTFLFQKSYPMMSECLNSAMDELAAACSKYAPLHAIYHEIIKDNV